MSLSIDVVAALIERGDTVLVQKRPAHKARGNLWEFPGGKPEAGESDEQALVRECEEELGVMIQTGALAWQTEHTYDDVTVRLRLYRASIVTGDPVARDAAELRFVAKAQLQSLPFCEADYPLLALLVEQKL